VETEIAEPKYWLKGDNKPDYLDNYVKHTGGLQA
jgi:hypothetical protein